jgi:hypothetical protein
MAAPERNDDKWLWPPPDQWLTIWSGLILLGLMALSNLLLSFASGPRFVFVGPAVATLGALLILYAKLPLFRQRQFFTFGARAIPEQRRPFYRWGFGMVVLGVLLTLIFAAV